MGLAIVLAWLFSFFLFLGWGFGFDLVLGFQGFGEAGLFLNFIFAKNSTENLNLSIYLCIRER